MPLAAGTTLGPYEILSFIGEGWMGAVYKARDTRLDRVVAIKVGAAVFSGRFEREARAVAALNHPNICTLYDVGPNYLVMEFIDGKPLAGPMAAEEVIRLGTQIAAAVRCVGGWETICGGGSAGETATGFGDSDDELAAWQEVATGFRLLMRRTESLRVRRTC